MQRSWLAFGWILLVATVGAGCILAGMQVAERIIASAPAQFGAAWAGEGAFTIVIFLPMLLIATPMALWLPRTARTQRPLQGAALGGAIGLGGLLLAVALAAVSTSLVRGNAGTGWTVMLAVGAGLTLVQAGAEEMLLRGWLQSRLRRYWPAAAAVLASSLLFMALHLLGGARSPLALVNLFLGGVLFGLLAERTGGLVAPIVAHWVWNASETLLLGLSPNPGTGAFGSAIDLDLVGSALWGGSDQGLNASLALSFALCALVLPLAAWRGWPGVRAGSAAPSDPPVPAVAPAPQAAAPYGFFLGDGA